MLCLLAGVYPQSLLDGVRVRVDGDPASFSNYQYQEFGKGSLDVLVEVTRGPLAYSYPPVVLFWRADCGDGAPGENYYTHTMTDANTGLTPYAIGMYNEKRSIDFIPACPSLEWSGTLLRTQSFSVTSTTPQRIDADVVVPNPVAERPIKGVFLDYRMVQADGFRTPWQSSTNTDTDTRVRLQPTAGSRFSGSLPIVADMKDGIYEIKAVAECTDDSSEDPFDMTETVVVQGRVSRVVFVAAQWDSGGITDSVTVSYSGAVECQLVGSAAVATKFLNLQGVEVSDVPRVVTCSGNVLTVSGIRNSRAFGDMDVLKVVDLGGNAVADVHLGFGTRSTRVSDASVSIMSPEGLEADVAAVKASVDAHNSTEHERARSHDNTLTTGLANVLSRLNTLLGNDAADAARLADEAAAAKEDAANLKDKAEVAAAEAAKAKEDAAAAEAVVKKADAEAQGAAVAKQQAATDLEVAQKKLIAAQAQLASFDGARRRRTYGPTSNSTANSTGNLTAVEQARANVAAAQDKVNALQGIYDSKSAAEATAAAAAATAKQASVEATATAQTKAAAAASAAAASATAANTTAASVTAANTIPASATAASATPASVGASSNTAAPANSDVSGSASATTPNVALDGGSTAAAGAAAAANAAAASTQSSSSSSSNDDTYSLATASIALNVVLIGLVIGGIVFVAVSNKEKSKNKVKPFSGELLPQPTSAASTISKPASLPVMSRPKTPRASVVAVAAAVGPSPSPSPSPSTQMTAVNIENATSV